MFKIYRPVKPTQINQWFGENKNGLYAKLGMLGHNGIDFGTPVGTPLYWNASCAGTIYRMEYDYYGGNFIDVITQQDGTIFKHTFYHLDRFNPNVKVGQSVDSGQLLGYTGNTGAGTTGPHLHDCELKPMGKDQYGNYYKLYPNNGYLGVIDPTPYFENSFVLDIINGLEQKISLLQQIINFFKKK